jgi:hypothetical protein
MPLLRTSPSDHTAFIRANVQLPTNGKVVKTTNVAPATSVAVKSVAIASISSAKAAPSTTIVSIVSQATPKNSKYSNK